MTPDGRRAWSFLALSGGAMVNTTFAAWAMFIVRAHAGLVFWLGLSAQALSMVCITALGALLVKRSVKISRDGAEITDLEKDV